MTHRNFCVIVRALFLEPVCSATNSAPETKRTSACGAAASVTVTEALLCLNTHIVTYGSRSSRYYLWRHKEANERTARFKRATICGAT